MLNIQIITEKDQTHTVKTGTPSSAFERLEVKELTAEQAVDLKKALQHVYTIGKFEAANDICNLIAAYRGGINNL